MATTAIEQIGELLAEIGSSSTFTARRAAAAEDLRLEVQGVGRIRFPISRAQARRLCAVARPARYGRGEDTLLDRRVRDTWEIPKSRVKIDKRRWNRTLLPVLEKLRADLGLPDGLRLEAALHGMLVYGPGQFFLRHRDSEKADEMVATLVVTLPGSFKGGELVVEHRGEKATYRAARKSLSFVAFYADCHHEVRPVKEGYRVVLTYNLMLAGEGAAAAAEAAATVEAVAEHLREHFETPLPPRWSWDKDAPPREPPDRLIYLLDHQYTERGIGWDRLKGEDAARVAVLRAAAERAGCETALALAEIHETWNCMEPDWREYRYRRHRHWERGEDDEWQAEEDPPANDPDAYELLDLVERGIALDRWLDPSGGKTEPIALPVDEEEVCSSTPSGDLEPYASEYEGYMGNYGNTMDRWYRRGALVLWPRERTFAVRAEASPTWALKELRQSLRAGRLTEAREMAAALLPFWKAVAANAGGGGLLPKVMGVAEGLERAPLAASLLEPFRVEALTPGRAAALVALLRRYGEAWARTLVSGWFRVDRLGMAGRDRPAWIASLPRLCAASRAADDSTGPVAGRLLLEGSWRWLQEEIEECRALDRKSQRDKALAKLARPIQGLLGGAAAVEADDLEDEAVTFLCDERNDRLVPSLVQMLRITEKTSTPELARILDRIGRHCARRLEARLERPARKEGDWSLSLPGDCRCDLCGTVGAFLADPEQRQLEWPLNKEKRRHVHGRLDAHELPVRHETRRSGRPYTLVLTKKSALFEREAAERRSWQGDLAWLAGRLSASGERHKSEK